MTIRLQGAKLALVVLIGITAETTQAEQYLCVADKATGFKYDKALRDWVSANFATDTKYVVSESPMTPTDETVRTVVNPVGENPSFGTTLLCQDPISSEFIDCRGPGSVSFRLNTQNLRFIKTSRTGYVEGNLIPEYPEGSDTPHIEIGKCSSF